MRSKQLVVSLALLGAALLPSRDASAQLAPTGAHYGGRPSDTGFTGPTDGGGFGASVPLDLPPARGGLPVPVQIVSGAKGFGAAGVGWDVPLSFVLFDDSFGHRRPVNSPGTEPMPRERITVALPGRRVEMLPVGDHWVGRYAADLTMRKDGATYVVSDASGASYTFVSDAKLAGAGGHVPGLGGLWLLDSIKGAGGALVRLHYDIQVVNVAYGSPPIAQPSPAISIDLTGVSYNPGPGTNCFKHEVTLNYDGTPIPARPQALAIIGEIVVARVHKVNSVDVTSRASCALAPERLRRYTLSYVTDPDTRQARLDTVKTSGRAGTPEAAVQLPIATYRYGSATVDSAGTRVLRYQSTPTAFALPPNAAAAIAVTGKLGTWPGEGTVSVSMQTLTDFTGDGLPDLVFADGVHTSIAAGKPGLSFAVPTQLDNGALSLPLLDIRTSDVDRFSDEVSGTRHDDYAWTQSIDVNGDGRVDIVHAKEQPNTWVVYLNTPDASASGVKWQRRTYDVGRLRTYLANRGLGVSSSYLPLSHRVTSRDTLEKKCFKWDYDLNHNVEIPITSCWYEPAPPSALEQQTYVEYELKDINGDGYPDFVLNSEPVTWITEPTPEDKVLPYQVRDLRTWMGVGAVGRPNSVLAFLNVAGVFAEDGADPFSGVITLLPPGSDCGVGRWGGHQLMTPATVDRVQSSNCSIADVNGDGIADRIDEGSYTLGTGHGFRTVRIPLPNSYAAAQQSSFADDCLIGHGTSSTAFESKGLRDLTGDGIPDYISDGVGTRWVSVGTGAGFATGSVRIEGAFALSESSEKCDGSSSITTWGLFDVNGDGHPDVVNAGPTGVSVWQLAGGAAPGNVESGRIVGIDNGYGASTTITYGSAKTMAKRHQVPFPEIVTTSVRTTGTQNLGGTTAATRYAYGDIDMFFDSTLDAFRSTGYLRGVALVGTSDLDDVGTQTAQIVDGYPLDPISPLSLQILTDAQRFGRYLRVGRVRDVTNLAGSLGSANALLTVNVDTDARRISGAHHEAVTSDTHVFADSSAGGTDCFDLAFPYDPHLSKLYAATYKPCAARGFLLTQSTSNWRGSAAPPSSANVQTATSVRSVDDLGRVTSVIYYNDLFRSDDDICVDTTYAASANQLLPALTAVASRKVWACNKGGEVLAEESWGYDGFPAGFALAGLPSSHTVDRHTGDTGAYLSTVREFDATYDAAANPVSIASTRDDGVKRTVQLTYDEFGVFAQTTAVGGTGVPTLTTSRSFDPVTGALLETKDPNGTARGTTYDGFGRPVFDTITPPDATEPAVLSMRSYIGFEALDPDGRRVLVKELTDPAAPNAVKTAPGQQSTTFFDELGRPRSSKVELGEDYASEVMIVGARTYDRLGRVVFEADAYPQSQDGATAYGTSRFFDLDGSLLGEIRGAGPQAYTTTPSAAVERFPTLFRHTFANHVETTITQTPDALTAGLPQNGVTKEATVTAVGRVLTRSTWKGGVRLEHEALGYDLLGQFSSIVRYQNAAVPSDPVTTTMQLDSLGQLLWLKEPMSAPQERTYSSWGELRFVTTYPQFMPTLVESMKYDALGRLLASEEINGGVSDPESARSFKYDEPGDSAFASPKYTAGRLASASTAAGEVVVSYDGQGRADARTYRDAQTQQKYFEQLRFHGDGSQDWVELRLPDNSFKPERMDYDYDTAGRLRWMWFSDGSNTQELYNATTIDPWGRTRKATFGKTDYAAAYAELGRRLPDTLDISSTDGIRSLRFTGFDPVGRELSREEDLPNSRGTTIQSYDPLGRLQGARRQLGATTTSFWTYSYDALGNVTNLDDQLGTADTTLNFGTADRDQICAISYGGSPGACNVDHDGFGNIVKYPTRTGSNRLSYFNSGDVRTIENESGVTAKFDYDAFGDVANLSIFRGGTLLRRDRHYGAFITERAQKDQASTLYVARRFPGPGVALSRRGPTGPWIYDFSESNGTRITTDENGKFVQDLSYTPFGAVTSTGARPGTPEYTTDQWNSGDALDGFGLVRLGKRIYDPAIGRFLSRDPLLIPRTSATTNPYAFAHNDPINLSDPTGFDPCAENPACTASFFGGSPIQPNLGLTVSAWALGKLGAVGPSPELLMNLPPLVNDLLAARSFVSEEVFARAQGVMKVASGAAGFVAGAALYRVGMRGLGITLMAGSADVAGSGVTQLIDGAHHATVAENLGGPALGDLEAAFVDAAGLAHFATGGGGPTQSTPTKAQTLSGGKPFRFAHGTHPNSVASVRSGLRVAEARGNWGGGFARGSFFSLEVPGPTGEGLQLAYEFGLRHSPNPAVMIGEMPGGIARRMIESGVLRSQPIPGIAGVNEFILDPSGFGLFNENVTWIDVINTERP